HVALHIALVETIYQELFPALEHIETVLQDKAQEWMPIIKSGRTHLQDAVPLRLGQEIGGFVAAIRYWHQQVQKGLDGLYEIGMGANAVGTGINAHPRFMEEAVRAVAKKTGKPFVPAANPFMFVQNVDAVLQMSGALRGLATAMGKIANDLRLLSSGPRMGLGEIVLPAVQPGSSIMPGKVNPVMAEMMNMICYQVMGYDTTVQMATAGAQLELNVMMPVIAYNILQSVHIMSTGITTFTDKALIGMQAQIESIAGRIEFNTSLATALNPYIGYERAAEVAKKAYQENKSVRQVVQELGWMDEKTLNEALDLQRLVP
ncbi:MAG: lyase family protein, partial [Firmicutes bacterium]|nr:lyase family protein [Bacillota bacterium]